MLVAPLRITVGERNISTSSVKQRLVFVGQESGKMVALRQMLKGGGLQPPVLVRLVGEGGGRGWKWGELNGDGGRLNKGVALECSFPCWGL